MGVFLGPWFQPWISNSCSFLMMSDDPTQQDRLLPVMDLLLGLWKEEACPFPFSAKEKSKEDTLAEIRKTVRNPNFSLGFLTVAAFWWWVMTQVNKTGFFLLRILWVCTKKKPRPLPFPAKRNWKKETVGEIRKTVRKPNIFMRWNWYSSTLRT